MPSALAKTNARGVPVTSIVVAAIVGCLGFGPFKTWNALVSVVTSATAIMYAFGPLSLAALHKLDAPRPRTYRVPMPKVMLPAGFCAANLIIYWGGFDTTWKLAIAMVVGLLLFAIGAKRARTNLRPKLRSATWMGPWLAGHVAFGALGRYGGGYEVLPAWIDIVLLISFSLTIFYVALGRTLTPAEAAEAIAKDAHQLDYDARA
jgi:amino acid transporter